MMYKVERPNCQCCYIVKTTKYDYIFLRLKFNPDYINKFDIINLRKTNQLVLLLSDFKHG